MSSTTGLDAKQLTPGTNGEFIKELNSLVRPAAWPWLLTGTLILSLLIEGQTARTLVLAVGSALTVTFLIARARHTVDVSYEVDGAIAEWHRGVRARWPEVTQVGAAWRVAARGTTQTLQQVKVNAGAGRIVGRNRVTVKSSPHSRVKSNISLPTFISEKHAISFLPDKILVRSGGSWNDLEYKDLRLSCHPQRLIENGPLPKDGQQVGTTWRYVNKNGGPDRRFNDNKQLPIMLYGEVELTTATGLRWVLQLSNVKTAAALATAVQAHPSIRFAGR
jgi:hypothetical protein